MANLTREQKFEERFARWAAPGVQFDTPEAEAAYRERVQMFKDVVQCKKPVRVPIMLNSGIVPFAYSGFTTEEVMYDYDKLGQAFKKYNQDFQTDTIISCGMTGSGPLFDILDYKLYQWPGHGVDPRASYQALEAEYMHADEYDLLINDPTDFFMRYYLPRVFGSLAGWSMLGPMTDVTELPFTGPYMISAGVPPIRQAFEKLLEAGQEALRWANAIGPIDGYSMTKWGLPAFIGGATKAPFDTLGDTLRGTRAIMLDKFRQPKKVLAAMERLVPLAVASGVRGDQQRRACRVHPAAQGRGRFHVGQGLQDVLLADAESAHRGPGQRRLCAVPVRRGRLQPAARRYRTRPGHPRGLDHLDFRQDRHAGGQAAVRRLGLLRRERPASMISTGTPEDVAAYVKTLLADVAGDGGFILSPGAVVDREAGEHAR